MAKDENEYYTLKFKVATKEVTAIYRRGQTKPMTYALDETYARNMVAALNKNKLKKLDK